VQILKRFVENVKSSGGEGVIPPPPFARHGNLTSLTSIIVGAQTPIKTAPPLNFFCYPYLRVPAGVLASGSFLIFRQVLALSRNNWWRSCARYHLLLTKDPFLIKTPPQGRVFELWHITPMLRNVVKIRSRYTNYSFLGASTTISMGKASGQDVVVAEAPSDVEAILETKAKGGWFARFWGISELDVKERKYVRKVDLYML
jgi:hypothetical protein